MEFVKYIINCFKVYYPKFLCKLQKSCKSSGSFETLFLLTCSFFFFFYIISAKMIIVDMPWILNGKTVASKFQAVLTSFYDSDVSTIKHLCLLQLRGRL